MADGIIRFGPDGPPIPVTNIRWEDAIETRPTLAQLYYEPPIWGLRPPAGELRAAGAELHAARLRAELETLLSRTWRGRLALRIWRRARRG